MLSKARIFHHIVLVALMIFAFGVMITTSLVNEWRDEQRLQKDGVKAEATVILKTTNRTILKGGKEIVYYQIRYKFEINGEAYTSQFLRFPYETWKDLQEGGPVAIMYLPDDPSVHRALGERARDPYERPFGIALGVLSIFVSLGLTWWHFFKPDKKFRII